MPIEWEIQPEHTAGIIQLQRLLSHLHGVNFLLIQHNDPAYRNHIIDLINQSQSSVCTIDLLTLKTPEEIEERLEKNKNIEIIHIINLESLSESNQNIIFKTINYHREHIAQLLSGTIIFWLTDSLITEMALKAADFWAWREQVFDFNKHDKTIEISHSQILNQDSHAKRERIREIEIFLRNTKNESTNTMADLKVELGRTYQSIGDISKALAMFEDSLAIYTQLGDKHSRAVTLGDIAQIRVGKSDIEGALKLHEEELAVYEGLDDQRSRAMTLGDIAQIRVGKGDIEGALKLHEETLSVFEDLGDQRERAITLGDIARIRVGKSDIEGAQKYQEERLEIARTMEDLESIGATQFDIANMKLKQEDFEGAMECLAESWQIVNQIGRADGIVAVGKLFGRQLCKVKQIEQAQNVLAKTREVLVYLKRDADVIALDEIIAGCGKS